MSVEQLINILNEVEDKNVEIKVLDQINSTSNNPKWIFVDEAYFNRYSNSFLIC